MVSQRLNVLFFGSFNLGFIVWFFLIQIILLILEFNFDWYIQQKKKKRLINCIFVWNSLLTETMICHVSSKMIILNVSLWSAFFADYSSCSWFIILWPKERSMFNLFLICVCACYTGNRGGNTRAHAHAWNLFCILIRTLKFSRPSRWATWFQHTPILVVC